MLEMLVSRELARLGVRGSDRVAVAVSGGADSTALLHLTHEVSAGLGIDVCAIHVDHGLRPDSDKDAEHVLGLAGALGVPGRVEPVSVQRRPRVSTEAVARDARYAALERAADVLGCRWVLTAHTLDDQAETVLLQMARGTGLGGLAGVAPARGRFLRPLLEARRADLRAWLDTRVIAWLEDPSNADADIERNWVRSELLPAMASRREGVALTLARLSDHARRDADLLDALAGGAFARVHRDELGALISDDMLRVHPAISTRVVQRTLRHVGARADAASVQRTAALVDQPEGASVRLGGKVTAWRFARGVAVLRDAVPPSVAALPDAGPVTIAAWDVRVRVGGRSRSGVWSCGVPGSGMLALRPRRPGDRVRTGAGTRKVSDVLRDARVPRPLRDRVPVLVCDERPIAVVGVGRTPVGSVPGTPTKADRIVDVEPLPGTWAARTWWSDPTS